MALCSASFDGADLLEVGGVALLLQLLLHGGRPQNGVGSPKSPRTRARIQRLAAFSPRRRGRWSRLAIERATQATAAELMLAAMLLEFLGSKGRGARGAAALSEGEAAMRTGVHSDGLKAVQCSNRGQRRKLHNCFDPAALPPTDHDEDGQGMEDSMEGRHSCLLSREGVTWSGAVGRCRPRVQGVRMTRRLCKAIADIHG